LNYTISFWQPLKDKS